MGRFHHLFRIGIKKAVIEMEFLLITVAQGGICVSDANKLHIVLLRELMEKTTDMTVLKAHNRDAQRLLREAQRRYTCKRQRKETAKPLRSHRNYLNAAEGRDLNAAVTKPLLLMWPTRLSEVFDGW
jgi:hypothetical protein